MTALPRMPPFFQALECLDGLAEREHPSNDGAQRSAVDEGTDPAQLIAAGAHKKELVADAELPGPAADACAQAGDGQAHYWIQAGFAGKCRIRRPDYPDGLAAGPEDAEGLLEVFSAKAVQNQIVTTQELFEVLAAVVDDYVGAKLPHEVQIGGTRRGRDGRTEVLGELDGDRPDSPRPGMDEDRWERSCRDGHRG